jgi:DNA repair exonuclease SbcCD ATPase subunit
MVFNMIFGQFNKPKWQHPDEKTRKQAIEALDAQRDSAILLDIARQDPQPQLRCLAARKINDMNLLRDLSRKADNWEVAQLAAQRYQQLMAGISDGAPPLPARLAMAGELQDAEFLEYLALNAKELELRQVVLSKVSRQSVLADVAIRDKAAQARLQAAQGLSEAAALERVAKASRSSDKGVYRIVRAKLDELEQAQHQEANTHSQREAICLRLEVLNKAADWERSYAETERLAKQWQELAGQPDAALAERFERAHSLFLHHWHGMAEQREAWAALRTEKQALRSAVEQLLAEVSEAQALTPARAAEVEAEIQQLQTRWQHAAKLPSAEERELHQAFADAIGTARIRMKDLLQARDAADALKKLQQEAKRLLKGLLPPRSEVESLQERNAALAKAAAASPAQAELHQSLQQTLSALQERLEHEQEERKQTLSKLKDTLTALDQAVEEGILQKSRGLESEATELLRQLGSLPKPRLAPLEQRLYAASAKIRQLRGWQHWGNQLERENLCKEMESLIGLAADPEEIARQVRAAQAEWKRLSEGDDSHALWHRFNNACQKAYAPCQEYFRKQAGERQQHGEQKQVVCEKLEKLAAETDWQAVADWKALHHQVQALRKEFYESGPTDRKRRKELDSRLEAALEALDVHLQRERARNLRSRQALIEKVQALLKVEDLRQATEAAKQAQAEWQITVPAAPKQERELWKAFHAACDAVFARRRQEHAEHEQTLQQHLAQKASLCEELEKFAESGEESAISSHLHKARGEWEGMGMVPKSDRPAIEKRFADACRRLEQRQAEWQRRQRQRGLENLKQRAALCNRLERLENPTPEAVAALRAEWDALDSAGQDAQTARALAQRFEQAAEAARQGRASSAPTSQLLKQVELLCIRMELLAGMDSPPESAKARMAYQVERLSKAMSGDKAAQSPAQEAAEIEREWYLSGAVGMGDACEIRFEIARIAFEKMADKAPK